MQNPPLPSLLLISHQGNNNSVTQVNNSVTLVEPKKFNQQQAAEIKKILIIPVSIVKSYWKVKT